MIVRIMRGLPGSGKSYFGEHVLPGIVGLEATIVSADHFFMKDGVYSFNPKQLAIAHKVCRQKFLQALLDARDAQDVVNGTTGESEPEALIVVDNTNTMPTEIAFYYDLATLFTKDVEILTIEPPSIMERKDWLKQCFEKNQHGVPMKSIEAMADRMKKHKLPWYWKEKMVIREEGHFILEGKELLV